MVKGPAATKMDKSSASEVGVDDEVTTTAEGDDGDAVTSFVAMNDLPDGLIPCNLQ